MLFRLVTTAFLSIIATVVSSRELPRYEGIYARLTSGALIELKHIELSGKLPKVEFGVSQFCSRCIPIETTTDGISALPTLKVLKANRVDRREIVGLVVKTRGHRTEFFLNTIVVMSEFVSGKLAEKRQSNSARLPIGTLFEYVRGATHDGRPTRKLDSSVYKFPYPSAKGMPYEFLRQEHAPDKLPPILALTDCGRNISSFRVEPIDQFTTEFTYKYGDFGNINIIGKYGKCGENNDFADIYGLAIMWNDQIYPIVSSQDLDKYKREHLLRWGEDAAAINRID